MTALNDQVAVYQQQQQCGQWVPSWKFAVNWLKQQCWEDEVTTALQPLLNNNQNYTAYKNQSGIDLIWEACKGSLDL